MLIHQIRTLEIKISSTVVILQVTKFPTKSCQFNNFHKKRDLLPTKKSIQPNYHPTQPEHVRNAMVYPFVDIHHFQQPAVQHNICAKTNNPNNYQAQKFLSGTAINLTVVDVEKPRRNYDQNTHNVTFNDTCTNVSNRGVTHPPTSYVVAQPPMVSTFPKNIAAPLENSRLLQETNHRNIELPNSMPNPSYTSAQDLES
ncbi:hypothetical protein RF11_10501 [Thelohanellus kitauei]|uniref:Uncharacterized protein n=1 Tax=Thelohanellus kitauei TaxID=669202 RepID=A0A0C2IAH3_THEKT|nr:hypothetical protein RF11_10501 [Thelohanellus kitauei]